MSWNVRTGLTPERRLARCWWARRGAIAGTLADLDADVVGLQEAHRFQWRWLAKALPAYCPVATRPRGRWVGEACPILVRRERFTVLGEQVAWFGDDGLRAAPPGTRAAGALRPRIVASVHLHDRWSDDDRVVVNTHLDTRRGPRSSSVVHLAAWVTAPGPPADVVMGDLNTGPDGLGPLLAGLHRAPADGVTFPGFDGNLDETGDAIDHVLVGPAWRVAAAAVVHPGAGGPGSDHRPVAVDLRPR